MINGIIMWNSDLVGYRMQREHESIYHHALQIMSHKQKSDLRIGHVKPHTQIYFFRIGHVHISLCCMALIQLEALFFLL